MQCPREGCSPAARLLHLVVAAAQRLDLEPQPYFLWDLGFLIRGILGCPGGMWPLRVWGFSQDGLQCRCCSQAKTLPQEGPTPGLQMGMSWGDTDQPTSGMLLPVDGVDMSQPVSDSQPSPLRTGPSVGQKPPGKPFSPFACLLVLASDFPREVFLGIAPALW